MIVLDTDTVTRYFQNHPRVTERVRQTQDVIGITIITRIETLQGRFDSVLKAADASQLQRAQVRLDQAEKDLARLRVVPIDATAAAEFDRLRADKKLKKIGRADLLIAAITLANRATLASRNLKDFQQVPGLQVENWID